ncbi:MAG: NAD(P)/FAD-dependent oxidoreductase [bacterium]|nr:NAD(P)/FAD-dependent oxidoreductase [bacterium]
MLYCDVLVVGAGPAGSSAAKAAAQCGAEVLVVEKGVVGEPVRCGEFVPRMLAEEVVIPSCCVAQEVRTMKVFSPGGEEHAFSSPGFILDRAVFDKTLAEEAEREGVTIMLNTTCIGRDGPKVSLKKGDTTFSVGARVVVGADGPRSTVGSWINENNTGFVVAMQYAVPLAEPMDRTEIYFSEGLFGGYGWLFPKKETANVGIGVKLVPGGRPRLPEKLNAFISRLAADGKILAEPTSATCGLIPVSGPVRTAKKNVILVGDAAGQTHPITGAGVSQAITCGDIAGRVAADAAGRDEMASLSDYDKEWRAIYADELDRAKKRRELMEAEWGNLGRILKKCWVSFREYYE